MIYESPRKFIVLAILDGWGIAPDGPGNAITKAQTPHMNKYWLSCPHTQLSASGEAVGLPKGEDGNTETGHLNLGAGRIVYQDLQRINMSIADGSFFENKTLNGAFDHVKKNKSKLHLIGLVGAGGVHSNLEHLYALIHLSAKLKFDNLFLHVFTDGRDSPPTAAKTYISNIEKVLNHEGVGKIASIMGRYWSMDRDQRWDRTEKAYKALTQGQGNLVTSPEDAIEKSYSEAKTDEFIEPALIKGDNGKPIALIGDHDAVIFFNFRIDRPRQLTKAFVFEDFSQAPIAFDFDPFSIKYEKSHLKTINAAKVEPFKRGAKLKDLYFVTMTEYAKPISKEGALTAFPPEVVDMPLSGVISSNGLRQLKITESEKERFVTYYFNGLREKPYTQEETIIIPSLKITTYDQNPEMKAHEIAQKVTDKLSSGEYSLVVVNFANADMVGHTGNIGAAVQAVGIVDECVGKLASFVLASQGLLLITSDHGNAEEMINIQTGEIDTEHSTFPVPLIAVSQKLVGKGVGLQSGILADIAPTILLTLGLPVPASMTGRNLLSNLEIF